MLSLVPLTGWSGQISLAADHVRRRGRVVVHRVLELGRAGPFGVDLFNFNGSPWGLLVAAAVAVPFGLLMALAGASDSKVCTWRWPRWRSRAWPSS